MKYISKYFSPLGEITITATEKGVAGLYFVGQKHYPINIDAIEEQTPVIVQAKKWLDTYFSGAVPNVDIPLDIEGTEFQREVWNILLTIPYGKTMTYGEIANIIAKNKGIKRMSAQAVGHAVSRNKIAIIIPCHRVVGANGSLVGYDGGIDKKVKLLKIEKII